MENRKYVVCRDNIYVGELVNTDRIVRYEGDQNFFNTRPGQLTMGGGYYSYRSMLFVPDEKSYSNDLLYNTPDYPVLNVTSDETCLNLGENSTVITDACNLGALLEYFGFGKELTYEEIMTIRKTFFTGRFAKDHCRLFGWREISAEDVTFLSGEKIVTDPRELERRRNEYRRKQRAGYRSFEYIGGGELPREYYDILDARGKTWKRTPKNDPFAPSKKEGKIRKLTK